MLVWLLPAVCHSSQSLAVPELKAGVDIRRDAYGIVHIEAQSEADAYFALGYVHAEDRLWQMEVNRRIGSGRLAEVFGPDALAQDRLHRTLGLRHVAAQNWRHLDADSQALLTAYAHGVNAYLGRQTFLVFTCLECRLFDVQPEPWQPVDSLLWLKTLAWQLSGNSLEEVFNLRLSQRLDRERLADLLPSYPGEPRQYLPDLERLYGKPVRAAVQVAGGRSVVRANAVGSNNWAVSGERSTSGKPLLANDPHVPFTAPALFYLAHLKAPGLDVIGATLPGVPGVLLGRNQALAWAFTNTGPDSQDLFFEWPVPDSPERYRHGEATVPFTVRQETLAVKGQAAEFLNVRSSRHGPVVSDVDADIQAVTPPGLVAALRWVGLAEDDSTAQFLLKAGRAQTVSAFLEAAENFHAPQQNMVYADRAGHIGFVAAGRVPKRRPGNALQGLIPAPGWLAEYDWDGYIPFAQLPQQHGSNDGSLVTANQKITPPGYPYLITASWTLPYRAQRIAALLAEQPQHDRASFKAIQQDVFNPVAHALLPYLLGVSGTEPALQTALTLLKTWDTKMTGAAAQPLIFAEWLRQLLAVLCQQRLGDSYDWLDEYHPGFLQAVLTDRHGMAGRWCVPSPPGQAPCYSERRQALLAALAELQRHHGDDLADWRWQDAHISVFAHTPFTDLPVLGSWFAPRVTVDGGLDTVNVSGYRYQPDTGQYVAGSGAVYRAIYDLADPDRSVFVLPTGQSGRPWSAHYRDMLALWAQGEYVPMHTEDRQVAEDTVAQTRLLPVAAVR